MLGNWRSAVSFPWTLLAAVLLLGGCSSSEDWHAETQVVQGTVHINGKPADGAIVTFHPQGEPIDVRETLPWGKVGSDGSYTLRTYKQGDGAPVGTYDVTLVWLEDTSVMGSPDQLRGAYDEVDESKWTVTIEEGASELAPIELEGVKLARGGRARPSMPPDQPPSR